MKQMMPAPGDETIRLLYARLDDLKETAARGEIGLTAFLTPREAKYARARLSARFAAGTAVTAGGYSDAERVRIALLPDYMEGLVPPKGLVPPEALEQDPASALRAAGFDDLADGLCAAVCAVRVDGSGYRTLSHRDYLGSILGLGLDRDAVGDIVVTDEHHAVVITGEKIADFLCGHLEKVASDTVKIHRLAADAPIESMRRFEPIRDTVASERLDCVVASLCRLSREKAQEAIRGGLVELDYEAVTDCDELLEPPAVLSARGYGKFIVRAFDGSTKKGRLRLIADRYI